MQLEMQARQSGLAGCPLTLLDSSSEWNQRGPVRWPGSQPTAGSSSTVVERVSDRATWIGGMAVQPRPLTRDEIQTGVSGPRRSRSEWPRRLRWLWPGRGERQRNGTKTAHRRLHPHRLSVAQLQRPQRRRPVTKGRRASKTGTIWLPHGERRR